MRKTKTVNRPNWKDVYAELERRTEEGEEPSILLYTVFMAFRPAIPEVAEMLRDVEDPFLQHLCAGLIVSCQAVPSPLHHDERLKRKVAALPPEEKVALFSEFAHHKQFSALINRITFP
jgi:hypothetical protein